MTPKYILELEDPTPMCVKDLMAYIEAVKEIETIEDDHIYINGSPVVAVGLSSDGDSAGLHLLTRKGYFDEHPPCPEHKPVQHRDRKPPWCRKCGLTARWTNPHTVNHIQRPEPYDNLERTGR